MTEHTTSEDASNNRQTASNNQETAVDPTLRKAFQSHTTTIETTELDAPLDDLEFLREDLTDATIVGLGEATHGTRDFFELKARIIRFMVERLGCRAVAFEADFPETMALDRYIVHGEGDPRDGLDDIYFWTWNVKAVLELVEWLRTFNEGRPLEDRVRFHGVDVQYTSGTVDRLDAFFSDVDPAFHDSIAPALSTIDDEGTSVYQDDELPARTNAAREVLPAIRDHLSDHREEYVATKGERELSIIERCVTVLDQSANAMAAAHDRKSGAVPEPEATRRYLNSRDRAMADAVDWILEFEDTEQVAVWAHDVHISRTGERDRMEADPVSMGSELADQYGDAYFAVGFAFGSGEFQAIAPDPDSESPDDEESDKRDRSLRAVTVDQRFAGSIDELFADSGDPLSMLSVRSAREDDRLAEWLATPQSHFETGATFDPSAPGECLTAYTYSEAFDAVCYVDRTERARPVGDQ